MRVRIAFRWLAAVAFCAVGVLHFTHARVFLTIMPPFIPTGWHLACVHWSGVFEILGGVGLLVPRTRRLAGWGLLALLVAVFPANIHMALNNVALGDLPPNPVAAWARLPFQLVFAAWIWWVAELGRTSVRTLDGERS